MSKSFEITDDEVIISGSIKDAINEGLKLKDLSGRETVVKDQILFAEGNFMSDLPQEKVDEIINKYGEYKGINYDKNSLACLDGITESDLIWDHKTDEVGQKAGKVEDIHYELIDGKRTYKGTKRYLPSAAEIVFSNIRDGKQMGASPEFQTNLDYRPDGVFAIETEFTNFADVVNPSYSGTIMNNKITAVNKTYDHTIKPKMTELTEERVLYLIRAANEEQAKQDQIPKPRDIEKIATDAAISAVKDVLNEQKEMEQESNKDAQLANVTNELDTLKADLKTKEEEAASLKEEITQLNEKISALEAENNEYKEAREKEIEEIHEENVGVVANYNVKNGKATNLESEKQRLRSYKPGELIAAGVELGVIERNAIKNNEREQEIPQGDQGTTVKNEEQTCDFIEKFKFIRGESK